MENKEVKITNEVRNRKNFGFDRGTIVEYNGKKILVSTIGMFKGSDGDIETLGSNGRYYETMCFVEPDKPTHEVQGVYFKGAWCIIEINQDEQANKMHENVVKEISQMLIDNKIKTY